MQDSIVEASYVYEVPKIEKFKNAFNHFIKFIGDFLFIIFIAIVLVAIVYGIYTKKNGNNGYVPIVSAYVIVSPSMVPTINVRDAVIAYRPAVSSLKKGDIITFTSTDARYSGLTVTHRILGITLGDDGQIAFKTKGDNNTSPDEALVLGSNIYGKVFFVVPWLGYLQVFLTKPYGWLLLVVLPCLIIIVSDIIKLIKTLFNSSIPANMQFKDVEILDDDGLNVDVTSDKDVAIKEKIVEDKVYNEHLNIETSDNVSIIKSQDDNHLYRDRYNLVVASNFMRNGFESLLCKNCTKRNFDIVVVSNLNKRGLTHNYENDKNNEFVDIDFLDYDIIDDNSEDRKDERDRDNSEIELL